MGNEQTVLELGNRNGTACRLLSLSRLVQPLTAMSTALATRSKPPETLIIPRVQTNRLPHCDADEVPPHYFEANMQPDATHAYMIKFLPKDMIQVQLIP